MGRDNKKHYICRDIKFRYILNLFITEGLFRKNKIVLYYLDTNRVSILLEKLSNLLTKKQNKNFSLSHCNYDISKMKNEKGIPLIKASGCDDLYEIVNKIDQAELGESRSVFDCLNEKLSPVKKDIRLYIRQQVALDIYHDLIMANVAHWLTTNRKSELCGKNPVLLIEKKSYWSYLILDYLKDKNISFKLFRQLNLKRNKGVFFTYHLIKLFVELVRSLATGQRGEEHSGKVKIGVSSYVNQNFTNFLDLRNYYLFWFYKSGIDPERVLIYVPDAKFNLSDEEVYNINKAKFNLTYCPTRITSKRNIGVPVYKCSFGVVLLLVQYLKQIIKMYFYARGRFMKEQWKLLSLLLVQLPYWEDFFTKNNIKIKFRFHDIFSIRDIAAKLSDVITLSYHYSNHSELSVLHQDICDIFFIWGKRYEQHFSTGNSAIRYLIQTGYVFDYTFASKKKKSIIVRDSLVKKNVSFIVGIFSENISGYLRKAQLEFYEKILGFAVHNPDIGIVIKPKKENDEMSLRSTAEVNKLIEILDQQGRMIFLDSRKYPVEVGFASDIVIGVIPDSTAGLECALAGIPMVIYDCTRRKDSHPLYKDGRNKIIFDDIQYLISAIDNNKERPGSIPAFADWSSILNITDSFRDGKANQRIETYIKTILHKLESGLDKDEAIEAANRAYAEEYGWDKVTHLH